MIGEIIHDVPPTGHTQFTNNFVMNIETLHSPQALSHGR